MKRIALAAVLAITAMSAHATPWKLFVTTDTGSKYAETCSNTTSNGSEACAYVSVRGIDPNTSDSKTLVIFMLSHHYPVGGTCTMEVFGDGDQMFKRNMVTKGIAIENPLVTFGMTTAEMADFKTPEKRALAAVALSSKFHMTVSCSNGVKFSAAFNPAKPAMDWISETGSYNLEYTNAKTTNGIAGSAGH